MRTRFASTLRRSISLMLLLGSVAAVAAGCLVNPAGPWGYAPAAVVAPAPVVVAPAPAYAWGWHYRYWQ